MAEILTGERVKEMLPPRFSDSNKGDYGKTAILAGSAKYSGAAALALSGALRGGAGYVAAGVPEKLIFPLIGKVPEALLLPLSRGKRWKFSEKRLKNILGYDSLAAGMGMENTAETAKIVSFLLSRYTGKLILDADGLNALARRYSACGAADVLRNKSCAAAITPHPAEFARLTGLGVEEIRKNGEEIAAKYAAENGVTVLLKGAAGNKSVITDGENTFLNATGNSGMAKGGSGDVLSGLIASIAASGAGVFEAACAGAYLAGKAAEIAVKETGEYSLTASAEAEKIGAAFLSL